MHFPRELNTAKVVESFRMACLMLETNRCMSMYEGFQFRIRLCFEFSHQYIILPVVACPSLFKSSRGRRELSYGPPNVEH